MMAEIQGYFDHNATTPMSPAARAVWMEMVEQHWHNPSSLYRHAGEAKRVLEDWRETLADLFEIDDAERIVFTSGATEANNALLHHLARSRSGALVLSEIEHPSVAAAALDSFGRERLRILPVDAQSGAVSLDELSTLLQSEEIAVVTMMAANNETGVLQPWREAAAICEDAGVSFHSDAAQWIGKMPLEGLGEIGFVTGSAHKFGGGKGCGFLILPEDERENGDPFHGFVGGPQEHGLRAGTEDLAGIAAMITALEEKDHECLVQCAQTQAALRDHFEECLVETLGVRILGEEAERLWNTSMFVLPHTKNLKWLIRLSQRGFAVSTGSACSAGKGNPSAVMAAMGLDFDSMGRVLRVSGGGGTSSADWEGLAEAINEIGLELAADRIQ